MLGHGRWREEAGPGGGGGDRKVRLIRKPSASPSSQDGALSVQLRVSVRGRGGGRHWLLVHSKVRDEGSGEALQGEGGV